MIIKLTQSFIDNELKCPEGKTRIEFCDSIIRGFILEVRKCSPGRGTFWVRYKDANGKTSYAKVGRTTDISLGEARKRASEIKASIKLGSNPSAEEKARKAVLTLNEFWTEHYFPFAKATKRSWKRDDQLFRLRIAPKFSHLRMSELSKQQITIFHLGLKDEGLAAASCDHHIKLLKRMLNLAVQWEFIDKNPATGIRLFNEDNKVDNSLDDTQLESLLNVLKTDKNKQICLLLQYILLTGARLNEAASAQWNNISIQNRIWHIPAATSKSKRSRSIPLNDKAIELLNSLTTKGTHEHLFINEKTQKAWVNIHKPWSRIRMLAGVPFLRLHDLRHTFATILVNNNRSLFEVSQILGHSDTKVTARYSHLNSKTLLEATNSASEKISTIMRSSSDEAVQSAA